MTAHRSGVTAGVAAGPPAVTPEEDFVAAWHKVMELDRFAFR